MNCVNCGCSGSKILGQSAPQDNINQFGRREISFTVESETIVSYGKDGLYHCSACGGSFTFQEAISQKKKVIDPQQRLS